MTLIQRLSMQAAASLLVAVSALHAQTTANPAPDPLYDEVARLDARLFDAYNTCDLKTLGDLVSDDLEFYHDKTGLAVGRPVFLQSINDNICGKVHRTLNPGSLQVHPLEHYGAVEMGAHSFTHPGHPEEGSAEAMFVMIWHNDNGKWRLTRVISYDHGPMHK